MDPFPNRPVTQPICPAASHCCGVFLFRAFDAVAVSATRVRASPKLEPVRTLTRGCTAKFGWI